MRSLMELISKRLHMPAKELIENGADVNVKGADDATPLHVAVRVGNRALVKLLLEKGANPNATTTRGNTPLHYVAGCTFDIGLDAAKAIVTLLLAHGADAGIKDQWGRTPLADAVFNRQPELADFMRSQGITK
jgi:hypothetical protein